MFVKVKHTILLTETFFFDIIIVTGKHCMAIVVLAKEKRHQGSKVTASLLTQTLNFFKILLFSSYQKKQTPEAATWGSKEMRASTASEQLLNSLIDYHQLNRCLGG